MAKAKLRAVPTTSKLDKIDQNTAIAMLLWANRHANPSLAVTIYEKDIEAFEACLKYQKQIPEVIVARPPGRPAQAAQPATENRSAIPAREAEGPKNYVVIALVEKGTATTDSLGNAITPIENNEDDFDRAMAAKALKRIRETAGELASRLVNDEAQGTISKSIIQEAAAAILALARA